MYMFFQFHLKDKRKIVFSYNYVYKFLVFVEGTKYSQSRGMEGQLKHWKGQTPKP